MYLVPPKETQPMSFSYHPAVGLLSNKWETGLYWPNMNKQLHHLPRQINETSRPTHVQEFIHQNVENHNLVFAF